MSPQGRSPAKKRMRFSSPEFDIEFGDLNPEALETLDQIELELSQTSKSTPSVHSQKDPFNLKPNQDLDKGDASAVVDKQMHLSRKRPIPSSSPEFSHPKLDSTVSFDFNAPAMAIGFQRAPRPNGVPIDSSNAIWLQPSKAALEEAAKKLSVWKDADEEIIASQLAGDSTETSATRPILKPINNSAEPLNSPAPSNRADGFKNPRKSLPFKSPLMSNHPSRVGQLRTGGNFGGSPLNPDRLSNTGFSTPSKAPSSPNGLTSFNHPLAATSENIVPANGVITPIKRPASYARPRFKTPFKQPQQVAPEQVPENSSKKSDFGHPPPVDAAKTDLVKRRPTLKDSGVCPRKYDVDQLESFGIHVSELDQINVQTAIYYSFHSPLLQPISSSYLPPTAATLGIAAALEHLLKSGCKLATSDWVDNHWRLILWKLAGMVCLEPEKERSPKKRWCWAEVIRQLEYRYHQEFEKGRRSPFKLITTRDAPASYPMVLCVSDISWSQNHVPIEDETVINGDPQVEVTDGWYRLRMQLDEPLRRAVSKGFIKVGKKLAVSSAFLKSERKDPDEILQAYDSCRLVVSGNSCHLAPWHAKLGFQKSPFYATLHSLTPDGGLVAAMNLEIIKVYPVAYLEFKEDSGGKKHREGPRPEADELRERDRWNNLRDMEASKLRDELEKKWSKWEGWSDRLESMVGAPPQRTEDDLPPDHIEDLFDDLDSASDVAGFMKHLSRDEAGWLAEYIRRKCEKDRSIAAEEIESELRYTCPPRDVRNFRVVVVKDAITHKRPAYRKAQLTVWDVLNITFSEEGKPGSFVEGQRFIVTNLIPSQQKAWMKPGKDSEIYLSTRRDSRWRPIH